MLLLPLGYSLLMEIHSKDFSQLCPAVWPAIANIQNKYTCIYERRALLYGLQTENNHLEYVDLKFEISDSAVSAQ